jgi:hypothetical protein
MDKIKNNSRERCGPRVRFGSASRPCPEDHHWNFSGSFFRRHSLILAAPGFGFSISLLQANYSNGLRNRSSYIARFNKRLPRPRTRPAAICFGQPRHIATSIEESSNLSPRIPNTLVCMGLWIFPKLD